MSATVTPSEMIAYAIMSKHRGFMTTQDDFQAQVDRFLAIADAIKRERLYAAAQSAER